MNEKTTDWADLQAFLAVVREGGLSPAARATGTSPATLGRRMHALERELNRELFRRHDRGYTPTDSARELEAALREAEALIARATAPAEGDDLPLVKVSAGTWTTLTLLDRLDELTGMPPDVRLRFVNDEAIRDIPHRDVAIGFRNHRPTDPRLAGRKLNRVEFAPYARPDASSRWILVCGDTPSARWLAERVGLDAACEVTAPRNALDLALAGRGAALLPTFVGERAEGLVRCGDTLPELAHDQWIVTHADDRHLPEVRRVIDRIGAAFG